MQNTVLKPTAFVSTICFFPVLALASASIVELKPPVWVTQGTDKTELIFASELQLNDQIITGDGGQIEIQLSSGAIVQLDANSDLVLSPVIVDESKEAEVQLLVNNGSACLLAETNDKLNLSISNTTFVAVKPNSNVCLKRGNNLSSVTLHGGGVQITHIADPGMIILSEVGTEFRIDDNGVYKLIYPELERLRSQTDSATTELVDESNTQPAIQVETETDPSIDSPADNIAAEAKEENTEAEALQAVAIAVETTATQVLPIEQISSEAVSTESSATVEQQAPVVESETNKSMALVETENLGDALSSNEAKAPQDTPQEVEQIESEDNIQKDIPKDAYIVYLFSTRAESVAKRVNRQFVKAGHNTSIYESKTGSTTRYRIGMGGFNSIKEARRYSKTIIGTLGITDTWIAKE